MQEELVKKLNILSQQEDEGEASEKAKAAEAFKSFIGLIRDGKTISKQDITRNAKFFRDEFTIEHVSRAQLEAMCNFMGIPTYGGDNLLRFQIRHRPPPAPACSVSLFLWSLNDTAAPELMRAGVGADDRLRQIQADDRKIWWEGIEGLDDEDLIEVPPRVPPQRDLTAAPCPP